MTANATPDPWARTRKGKPSLGEVATREYTLIDEHAQAWAEISQDFNPLHFDEDAAAKSIFGRRVGHGGLMQAVLHGIVGMDLPGPGTVFLHLDWRLQNPVYFDETVVGRIEVLEVRDDKPMCLLAASITRPDDVVALSGTCRTWTSPLD
jgi:acyl dehydratase